MGNGISGLAGRSAIAMPDTAPETALAAGSPIKILYGTASQELMKAMEMLKQFPSTAQALVRTHNPDMQ